MNTYSEDKMYENYSSEIERMQKCIDELHQENKQLQEELEEYKNPIKYFKYANKNVVEENKQLKDNWNKLKEYIRKNIIYDDVGMKILDPSPLEDYMQELEKGSDKE